LMCLLFAACAYIYKLHCLMKVSSKEISTVQTDKIRPVVSHCKGAAPAAKRMSVVHSAHLPTWCKDIYLCSTLQLEKNSSGHYTCGTVRTKNKYHVQQDCPALRNSQVLQVSLCKLCENKHKWYEGCSQVQDGYAAHRRLFDCGFTSTHVDSRRHLSNLPAVCSEDCCMHFIDTNGDWWVPLFK
jgi:hypothetical protein